MSTNQVSKQTATVLIIIDCVEYRVPIGAVDAVMIRQLPSPPIPEGQDLFLEQPGEDRKLGPGDMIELQDGMVFYTAPCSINPGGR